MALAFNRFDNPAAFAPSTAPRADLGAYELAFIRQQRGRRASWSAIAGMLKVSEDAVRRLADPDYVAPDWRVVQPAAPKPAASVPRGSKLATMVRPLPPDVLPNTMEARALLAMAAGLDTSVTLGPALRRTRQHALDLFGVLMRKGLAVRLCKEGREYRYELTEAGAAEAARHQALPPPPPAPDKRSTRADAQIAVMTVLAGGPAASDIIAARLGWPMARVSGALESMRGPGRVEHDGERRRKGEPWVITDAGRRWLADLPE